MSAHSLVRADTLVQLLAHVLPQDYGHGAPACTPADVDLFWPDDEDEDDQAAEKTEAAKAICAACPIEASCLAWALRTRAVGVLGGTTADERRRMLRSARRRDHYAETKVTVTL
jgi:WhiB family redox-sensing transcriptional regulator